jgi:RpiR family carbohydrate utilization transcriptional regulator
VNPARTPRVYSPDSPNGPEEKVGPPADEAPSRTARRRVTRKSDAASPVLDGASCIARIQSLRESLTPGQRRVGDAVLRDPHAVILATVGELAARSGSSEAAVSRFARVLGYGSYAEFKVALSRDLVGSTQAIHEDVEQGDDVATVAEKVTAANIRAIEDTHRGLDLGALEAAAKALSSASRIAFFGFGVSGAIARDARHHFMRTSKDTVSIEDAHEQVMWATSAQPSDVVLLFSHTGTSRDLCDVAELARAEGATVISVTNHGTSPLTKRADICLYTSSRETRYREESVSSRIAAMTIIDILYVVVSLERSEEHADRRDKIRRAILRKRA